MSYKFNSGSLLALGSTTTLNDIFSWSTSETILNSRRGNNISGNNGTIFEKKIFSKFF